MTAKPFVKWVGGKKSILPQLLKRAKVGFTGGYFEPFIGGGALFFKARPHNAHISDINPHLINSYKAVRDNVEQVIQYLKHHKKKHNKEYFKKMRLELGIETHQEKMAAIFIYLNKTCFNGLYRVNKQGIFNVPIGSYKNPTIVDEENLRDCSMALKNVTIQQHSFSALSPIKNAFYYLDPPYHKAYNQYDASVFCEQEHKNLADFCHKLHKTGAYFMVSNSDTTFIRSLYSRYVIDAIQTTKTISAKAQDRVKKSELIIKNYD